MLIRNRTHYAVAAALVAALALAGCKKKEEPVAPAPAPTTTETPAPAPVEPAPAPAALSVVSVTLGTVAGPDKKIATPTTSFKPTDKIVASVATDGTATNAEVAAKLVYQDGQTAGEEKQTLNTTGAETTNFQFAKASPWPAGKYKVEITANGAVANTTELEVK
ncbi:hypothetical protein GLA29479_290 [Lysobacter antibioticus]|jgi:hypothetical protein|uniref:hypothetical protein n=1 Tax=Lysobacter antibioticus TaxID=84531 RepID=UPI000717194F|nr:hypothetical protein [Lysobacter antibioticus]ALN61176.1 hypothetical protein GLA29479_290 [Lysobacter antibioticus]